MPQTSFVFDQLPAKPLALTEVLRICADPTALSKDLEGAIALEPALAALILKTVNSTYYGLSQKVSSLDRAIVVLGFSVIRNLATSLLLFESFNKVLCGPNRGTFETVWRRANIRVSAVQSLSRSGASSFATDWSDIALVALLTDIGHLIMVLHFGEDYSKLAGNAELPSSTASLERFGTDASQARDWSFKKWEFPPSLMRLFEEDLGGWSTHFESLGSLASYDAAEPTIRDLMSISRMPSDTYTATREAMSSAAAQPTPFAQGTQPQGKRP